MIFETKPDVCKHNMGFTLGGVIDYYETYGWYCRNGCGFFINFNPCHFLTCTVIVVKDTEKLSPPLSISKY